MDSTRDRISDVIESEAEHRIRTNARRRENHQRQRRSSEDIHRFRLHPTKIRFKKKKPIIPVVVTVIDAEPAGHVTDESIRVPWLPEIDDFRGWMADPEHVPILDGINSDDEQVRQWYEEESVESDSTDSLAIMNDECSNGTCSHLSVYFSPFLDIVDLTNNAPIARLYMLEV